MTPGAFVETLSEVLGLPRKSVAVIDRVVHDPGQPFAMVTARPTARLSRSRHLLLVFPSEPGASHDGLARLAQEERTGEER